MRYFELLATAISSFSILLRRWYLSPALIPIGGHSVWQSVIVLALTLLISAPVVTSADDAPDASSHIVWIGLANGLKIEATMAAELRDLIREHDVEPWILTRRILIDKKQIPHSHPILTIHTRHIGEEIMLLSTFVHEQLHWLEDDPWRSNFQTAMREFEKLFPTVPSSADGGARDEQSTYRHLLVCDMELQALTALVGQSVARETLTRITHYEWIYDKVLSDPRIREIALRNGFNTSNGVPNR